MKLTIKSNLWKSLCEFIFIILLCEKIYNHTYITGNYNSLVTAIFAAVSLVLLLLNKVKFIKSDFYSIAIIFCLVLYLISKETIRYGMILFSLVIWNKIDGLNIDMIHKVLTILGIAFSLIDYSLEYERISGFIAGSPTVYSCASLISFVYFMFKKQSNKVDYIFAFSNFIMILMTQSTSTIILSIGFICYKIAINIVKNININKKILKTCILIIIIIASVIVIYYSQEILSLFPRDNRDASTMTRLGIYKVFWEQWLSNVSSFIIGYGGGYTQRYVQAYWSIDSYLPIHQDLLMFTCEYGLLGMFVLYKYIFSRFNFNILLWMVIVLSSFHNIILSPLVLCLLIITSKEMNSQYGNNSVLWS